jgi:hypothetical protein
MQQANVKLLRVAKVPTTHLWAAAGLDPSDNIDQAREELKKRYAPFPPRLVIFWQAIHAAFTVVGIEVMSFAVGAEDQVPRAGVVSCDPARAQDVHEADGALQSELERIGIPTYTREYEWRAWYEISSTREPGQ